MTIEPVWIKVAGITTAIFLIYLADAMLSFWVPGFLEGVLGSGLKMGMVMSFSSMVGLGVDFLFPQVFPKAKVAVLYLGAVVMAVCFALSLWGAISWPKLVVLLAGMVFWGIYYELLLFANQQFVAETVELEKRTRVWAVMRSGISLAYVLGPILAGWLLVRHLNWLIGGAMGLALLGSVLVWAGKRKKKMELASELGHVNLVAEVRHWWVLIEHVWPVLVMSVMLALVDASFWTVGAVFAAKQAVFTPLAGLWLSAYMLPSLLVGLLLMKWRIYRGKKRWAAKLMVLSGLGLSGLMFNPGLGWGLVLVFAASCFGALALPLIDAVYTDLVSRMGRERKHLIGLSSATSSVAYVVGPVMAGFIADTVGEVETFAVMGVGMVVVGLLLLIMMPKKLRLPQAEIKAWTGE